MTLIIAHDIINSWHVSFSNKYTCFYEGKTARLPFEVRIY